MAINRIILNIAVIATAITMNFLAVTTVAKWASSPTPIDPAHLGKGHLVCPVCHSCIAHVTTVKMNMSVGEEEVHHYGTDGMRVKRINPEVGCLPEANK